MRYLLKMQIIKSIRSQYNLAKAIGHTDDFVSRVICERRNLTEAEKEQWCDVLGISDRITFDKIYNEKS